MSRWPLLQRIAVGNALIIIVGAVGGTLITRQLAGKAADWWLIVFFATIGISLSVVINSVIVRTALRPVRRLREEVDDLQNHPGGIGQALLDEGDPDLRRLARSIQAMVRELEERNRRLRALSERFIDVQERERLSIARSLHDDTGQALSTLSMRLERMQQRLPSGESTLRRELESARSLATDALHELRHVIYGLRPSLLDDLGLVPAIRSYARSRLEAAGVRVEVRAPDEGLSLQPAAAINLYRIAQEAVNNIVRHAAASTATISLYTDGLHVHLEVEDDGRGFDVASTNAEALPTDRLGLLGIEERALLLGGAIEVVSSPGDGTRIVVSLPAGTPGEANDV